MKTLLLIPDLLKLDNLKSKLEKISYSKVTFNCLFKIGKEHF